MPIRSARSLIVITALIAYCLLFMLIFITPAKGVSAYPGVMAPSFLLLAIGFAIVCMSDDSFLSIIFFFLFSSIPVLASIKFKYFPYLYNIIVFFMAAILIQYFKNKMYKEGSKIGVEIEHISEERNFLIEAYKKREFQIDSLIKKYKRYIKLRYFAEELSQSLSLEDVSQLIVNWAAEANEKSDTALLFLVDEEKQDLALFSSKGKEGHPRVKTKKGDIFDHWVLKQRNPLIVKDAGKDFRFSMQGNLEDVRVFRSIIAAPLMIKRKVLGVIRLDSPEADVYTSDDLRLLDIMANISAVALDNAFLYKKTLELATKDGLTGLFLNRYFRKKLSDELARSLRQGSPCSLIMLDIDNFKMYNDNYGHSAGDIVLKEISKIMRKQKIEDSLCARYGGEEFVMILPGFNKEEAIEAAEKIRLKISENVITLRRERTSVTASIGVVTFPDDAYSPEELIKAADMAMYKAKQTGKNKVWSS